MAGKRGNLCFAAFAWQLMSLRHMALRACAKYVCCVSYDVLILRHGVVKRIVVCCLWTLLCGRDLLEPSTAQVCWCVCVVRNWRVWKSSLSFCIPWTDVQTCGVVLMDAFFFFFICVTTHVSVMVTQKDFLWSPWDKFWSCCLWCRDLEQCTICPYCRFNACDFRSSSILSCCGGYN